MTDKKKNKTGFNHVTLALDLSMSQPGFAVLALLDDGSPLVLETSYITTKGKHGAKLNQIGAEITRLFTTYHPEHVVREQGFSRFARTTQAIFKVVGVSDALSDTFGTKEVAEIATTSVKKAVTGNGKASKEDVAESVFRILQIGNTDEFYTKSGKLIDDMTDAAAVGIAYLIREGLIE